MRVGTMLLAAAAVLTIHGAPALAAADLSFEAGDLSGWASSGPAAALDFYGNFTPVDGAYLGVVEAGGGDGVYSTLSRTFTLAAGSRIEGKVGFQAQDSAEYNDDAYLSVNGTNLLAWTIADVGDFAASGWTSFSFTAPTAGDYVLQLGVANRTDNDFSSGAVIDAVAVIEAAAVPEPASWALMTVGFGAAGAALRRRRRAIGLA